LLKPFLIENLEAIIMKTMMESGHRPGERPGQVEPKKKGGFFSFFKKD